MQLGPVLLEVAPHSASLCGQRGGDVGLRGRLYGCCRSVLCLFRSVCLCCVSLPRRPKARSESTTLASEDVGSCFCIFLFCFSKSPVASVQLSADHQLHGCVLNVCGCVWECDCVSEL